MRALNSGKFGPNPAYPYGFLCTERGAHKVQTCQAGCICCGECGLNGGGGGGDDVKWIEWNGMRNGERNGFFKDGTTHLRNGGRKKKECKKRLKKRGGGNYVLFK